MLKVDYRSIGLQDGTPRRSKMPLNIADVDDIWLDAETEFEELVKEVDAEFYRPVGEALIATMLASLTPAEIKVLQQAFPLEMDVMLKNVGG